MKTLFRFLTAAACLNLVLGLHLNAQSDNWCSQSQARQRLIEKHPEILEVEQAYEQYTKEFVTRYMAENGNNRAVLKPIIIPVVFHIISQGGSENISDAQVIDQINLMNRDYNKQNSDTADVYGDFKNIIAEMGIQFRLATIDPNGNCTNGIDRIISDQTYVGDDYSKLNGWPRNKYVNVWLVKKMAGGAAGYAYYPSSVAQIYSTPNMDGVIILNNYIGSIGTSSVFTSRALTHEIGHCFNLQHCWGNTNDPGVACGDDEVNDTPPTKGWTSCPSPANSMKCTPGVVENYQNYMEYSYCSRMFTLGQKARMMAALNSPVADRNNLYTDSNLIATGTTDTSRPACAPICNFAVSQRFVCQDNKVTFYDASGNGEITSYSWTFPGGTPPTSTEKNPQVAYSSAGWKMVTHTVTNSMGWDTKTDSAMVFVGYKTALYSAPYSQSFDDPNILNRNQWASINLEEGNTYNDNRTWFRQVDYASHSGAGSIQLNNFFAHANLDINEIVSPGIDLTALPSSQLNMTLYYSRATANDFFGGLADSFVVYASKDCGTTWSNIYHLSGINAVNAGFVEGFFVPTQSPSFWKKVNIAIPGTLGTSHDVIFKFQAFTTVNGNNLYIDDINIGNDITGVEELSSVSNLNLYPNPTNGNSELVLELANSGKITVTVFDIQGKEVLRPFDGMMNDGINKVEINGSGLAAGIYVVNIKAGENMIQRKLVIK